MKDELGGANVDCCGCPNGLGAVVLLKLAPVEEFPRVPSRDFGVFSLRVDVSGVIWHGRARGTKRDSVRNQEYILSSCELSGSRHLDGTAFGWVVVVWD